MINVLTLAACSVLAAICVGMHYESMRFLGRWMGRKRHQRRQGVVVVVLGLLSTHVVEIWLFAGAYAALVQWPDIAGIRAFEPLTAMDFVYFSSVVYTTLGFGDMVPVGVIRMLTGTEALIGFGLLTWSASFTFLEMQRFWPAVE